MYAVSCFWLGCWLFSVTLGLVLPSVKTTKATDVHQIVITSRDQAYQVMCLLVEVRQTDRQIDRQTDGWTNRQTDRQTDRIKFIVNNLHYYKQLLLK